MRVVPVVLLLMILFHADAQTIGGSATFSFLRLPNTPQLTALGGVNVSHVSGDVGMAFYNPALLNPSMHTQVNAVFNDFYAGVTAYHLSAGYYHQKLQTSFLWGLHYLSYGSITETDAAGNVYGTLKPKDWVMQVAASKKYMNRWNFGVACKIISSNYGLYRASGIAVDAGILYRDTANNLSVALLARNMGTQVRTYAGTREELPFDLVAGVTKRLEGAPFGFSFTAHHLHQFDIRYNDTAFNNANYFDGGNGTFTFDNIFRHFVLAATIYIGDKVEASIGYNHLRRKELNIGNAANGVNGFSIGAALVLQKLQVRFARAYYQNNTAYNQLGINMKLNALFGLGDWGNKIGW